MGINRSTSRAVFIDRDGVINRPIVREGRPYAPATLNELQTLPGVADALERLRAAGFRLVVVTNQPDIARGNLGREVVDEMHAVLGSTLPIDEFRVCDHDDKDNCACRKPKPGLLKAAAHEAHIHLPSSFMIGDRWVDIEAGRRAGCTTIFIDYGYQERRPEAPDMTVPSLGAAVDWIMSHVESEDL